MTSSTLQRTAGGLKATATALLLCAGLGQSATAAAEPDFTTHAAETFGALESDDRPSMADGRLAFPDGMDPAAFADTFADLAKRLGSYDRTGVIDVETEVRWDGGETAVLRVVAGRDGTRSGDGGTLEGVVEKRPRTILIAVGGDGGDGATGCDAGGSGGSVDVRTLSPGGAVIALGGEAGAPGRAPCRVDDEQPDAEPGKDGGDARAVTEACAAAVVFARGGNGGNGTVIRRLDPAAFGIGGPGGAGGDATADCQPVAGKGPCLARAVAGNGGHGASGENRTTDGRRGGEGGDGGAATATSCCGRDPERRDGTAGAVGGSGGNGGHGGNGLINGGNARSAGRGGDATAIVRPGLFGSEARAVAGTGGNGGNGGNGIRAGGVRGVKGGPGGATATNTCKKGKKTAQSGNDGNDGTDGNPAPGSG